MTLFQCSSASRKFLNGNPGAGRYWHYAFQCSSASRKFLNQTAKVVAFLYFYGFQCSSASRKFLNEDIVHATIRLAAVSVLFSEPKIPQCCRRYSSQMRRSVSVLFSEPKIPQSPSSTYNRTAGLRFSALQRAENSSISSSPTNSYFSYSRFSALQRAENSSIECT